MVYLVDKGFVGDFARRTLVNAGENYTATASTANTNYTLTNASTTFSIARKEITISGITAGNKTYDGTTAATLDYTGVTYGGKLSSDTLTVSATGTFAYPNAADDKTVTITGLTLDGASKDNYVLAASGQQSTAKADISPADYTLVLDATQQIKVGSGLAAIRVDDNKTGTGVGSPAEQVTGTFTWHTASPTGNAAVDTDISALTVGEKVTLYWSFTTVNTNYVDAAKTGATEFEIVEGDPQDVIFDQSTVTKTFGDEKFTVPVTVESNGAPISDHGALAYTSTNPAVATVDAATGEVTIVAAGSTQIQAVAAAVPGMYAQSPTASFALTVEQKEVPVVWSNTALTYTGEPQKPTAAATGLNGALVVNVAGEQTNAGTGYTATATFADSNYKPTNDTTQFSIAKAVIAVNTATATDRPYVKGNEEVAITDVTFTGLQNSETLTLGTDFTVTGTMADDGAGEDKDVTVTVTLSDTAKANNYQINAAGSTTVNITKVKPVLVADLTTVKPVGAAGITVNVTTTNSDSALVNFAVADPAVATGLAADTSVKITAVKNGATTVTVTADETDNFLAPDSIQITVNAMAEPVTGISVSNDSGESMTAQIVGETVKVSGVGQFAGYADLVITLADGTVTKELIAEKIVIKVDGNEVASYAIDATAVIAPAANVTYAADPAELQDNDSKITAAATPDLVAAFANQMKAAADRAGNTKPVIVTAKLTLKQVAAEGSELLRLELAPSMIVTVDSVPGTAQALTATSAPMTVTLTVDSTIYGKDLYVKVGNEYLAVTKLGSNQISWQQTGLEDVELYENVTKTVTFRFENGSTQQMVFTAANIGDLLPEDTKSGYRFAGWTVGNKSYTTLTAEAFEALVDASEYESAFTSNSSGTVVNMYSVKVPAKLEGGKIAASPMSSTAGSSVTLYTTPDKDYQLARIKVLDKNGNALALTNLGGGKYRFTMPAGHVTVEAKFVSGDGDKFTDVPQQEYYYDAVHWAVENGITMGLTDTTFGPNASCTRAQMVTFLWRAAGCPEPTVKETKFTDLNAGEYYYKAVLWAVEKGITVGMTETTFGPDETVTRAQAVTFLYRMAGKPAADADHSFTDVEASDYFDLAVSWAAEEGITLGTTATTYGPDENCIRAQIVTFIYRYMN